MSPHALSDSGDSNVPMSRVEPIAVVGIGCRMPGEVRSPSDMWKLLMRKGNGRSAKVPESRFNIDAYLHSVNDRPGSFNVPGGFFIEDDLDAFDPSLFDISPVEALWMDPQQRKLLEVVYEAFESSGTTLDTIAESKTGCFVGCFSLDYQVMSTKEPDFRHSYAAMGVDTGIISNRISHVFDLRGPSALINTACSSSLYALDLACKAILSGECEASIVGGTNLMLTVDQQMNTAKMGVLSPNSQSRPFDDAADGYGRGEGIGALYLKPLSAALRDGDPVRSIIRATATSHNGQNRAGISRPSIKGQTDIISMTYGLGNLDPDETSYIECHGTGTPVGDPIEIKAIHEALGSARPTDKPILVGSVKANVGHGEGVSSIATLIKVTLALENGLIPPTAAHVQPSSTIPWNDLNVRVVTEPVTISPCSRIGVNAFGYGGTNAHAILESVKKEMPTYCGYKTVSQAKETPLDLIKDSLEAERPHLLLFSGHNSATLKNNVSDISKSCEGVDLLDLAYTLSARRTKHEQRTFAVITKDKFTTEVNAASEVIASNTAGRAVPAFVFTGQGAQWPQMGAGLLEIYPSVRQLIQKLDWHLSNLKVPPSWKIEEILTDPQQASLVNDAEYAQPLCTAIQIALVDLLGRWGLKPAATVGHSSGEIAASYAAGIISAESAVTIAYFRGKVAASLRTDGAMLSLGMGAEEAEELIDKESCRHRVVVACHNSPSNVTLSGDRDAIEKLQESAQENKVFARTLATGGKAYHSHHMSEAASKYLEYLNNESVTSAPYLAETPMFSTVETGRLTDAPNSYWITNLTNPVLFNQGVQSMLCDRSEVNLVIEIGPHSALSGPIRQICQAIDKKHVPYLPTLKRHEKDAHQVLKLAGELWIRDASLNFETVTGLEVLSKSRAIEMQKGSLLVDLPTYHWTYPKSALAEGRTSREHRTMEEPRHDILGRRTIGHSPVEPLWRNVLRQRDLPWLGQHKLAGEVMLPAAAYLALAIEAIRQLNSQSPKPLEVESYTMRDVVISTATVVPDDDAGTETLFRLRPIDSKLEISSDGKMSQWYEFSASCCSYGAWKETAHGLVSINAKGKAMNYKPHALSETPNRGNHLDWLEKEQELGIYLGPAFHWITDVYTDGKSHIVRGDMSISQDCSLMEEESYYVLHPTVIDSCLQPFVELLHQGRLEEMRCGIIPTHFGEVTIFPPTMDQLANKCLIQLWSDELGKRSYSSNVQLVGSDNALIVDMKDSRCLQYRAALPQDLQGNLQRELYMQQSWDIDSSFLGWANDAGCFASQPLGKAVSAIVHKDAAQRVLCLESKLVPDIVSACPSLRMTVGISEPEGEKLAESYAGNGNLTFMNLKTLLQEEPKENYSLVVSTTPDKERLKKLHKVMVIGGYLLICDTLTDSESWDSSLRSASFSGVEQLLSDTVVVAKALDPGPLTNGHHAQSAEALLVYRDSPGLLHASVADRMKQDGWLIRSQALGSVDGVSTKHVVLLADAEGPLLNQLDERQLNGLINLTESASSMIWVSCGGLLTGDKPEYGMTPGATRTIRNEKGALDLVTVDFNEDSAQQRVAEFIAKVADRQRVDGRSEETEYCLHNGVVYVGRIKPHENLNRSFVSDSGETTAVDGKDSPALVGEQRNGTIVYDEEANGKRQEPLDPEDVEVKVAAIGLSIADGADDTPFLSHEIAGTVTRIGSNVRNIVPGTAVAGFAMEWLSTFQKTSSLLVQPLPQDCSMTQGATLPTAFVTATYCLEELAHIQPEDTVVVIDGMGSVGQAAIQVCSRVGVRCLVVTSSEATADSLKLSGEASSVEIILNDSGRSLSEQINSLTAGAGTNIVLSPATANHGIIIECGRTLAPFGRMVTLGHSNDYRSVSADLPAGARNLSFFQVDLANLIKHRPRVVATTLKECMDLYAAGQYLAPHPLQLKKPTEINQALQSIPLDMGLGKLVVTYEQDAIFEVDSSHTALRFRDDATYLLVGCLGGLGRQVALWMSDRGAKHLAFVSRSAADTPSAAETVELLRSRGVDVTLLRANIASKDELTTALSQTDPIFPIRGVLNAASVFRDTLFDKMTIDAWKAVADTKVHGSLNLHEAFQDKDLDFFVMTSSVASTLGSSGQTNYSAANSLLDSLARHRHARGLPAVSLILPAIFGIGHIAENRELERSIQMKGMYGIREREMLEAFEVAMRPQASLPAGTDHIIVGLQPRRFGPAVTAAGANVLSRENPRLNWIATAVGEQVGGNASGVTSDAESKQSIATAIRQGQDSEAVIESLTVLLGRRLGRLLMIEEESISLTGRSVASHGLDSMIGAEFRNWLLREFKVNVPFQQLLAGSLTVTQLAGMIYREVTSASE